jgi:Mrp family chromosome partitioning ATPase
MVGSEGRYDYTASGTTVNLAARLCDEAGTATSCSAPAPSARWRTDADVYGPSQPRMLGVSGRPSSPDGKTIMPLRGYGVTVMSMGFMVDEEQSVVWRGPMLMSALTQMLHQVAWGTLDYLIVDLPPGTGDVQLTLSQKANVSGAVVVSTPQDIALIDAKKALDMFRKTGTPVLGMIENMSTFCCPNCGHETQIFGHGGARREAERLGLPFLAAATPRHRPPRARFRPASPTSPAVGSQPAPGNATSVVSATVVILNV